MNLSDLIQNLVHKEQTGTMKWNRNANRKSLVTWTRCVIKKIARVFLQIGRRKDAKGTEKERIGERITEVERDNENLEQREKGLWSRMATKNSLVRPYEMNLLGLIHIRNAQRTQHRWMWNVSFHTWKHTWRGWKNLKNFGPIDACKILGIFRNSAKF